MSGTLYVVATPIGNLEDITLRALRVLKEVDLILAEDTRVTSKILNHYDIKKNILSYHQHSSQERKLEILKLLLEGKDLALVTDAGTPGISDPGGELIDFLLSNYSLNTESLKVVPVPGPSALTAALSVCGFRADKFVFLGFLPKKGREKLIKWLSEGGFTFAFYESPNRILKTLTWLLEVFDGGRRVFVGRELTKVYESIYRGDLKSVIEEIKAVSHLKGEIVVVVEGK